MAYQQPRLRKIKRVPRHSALLPKINDAVEYSANKFNVTKSFVVATALAHFFGINEQPDFVAYSKNKTKKRIS